jgi:cytochrome c
MRTTVIVLAVAALATASDVHAADPKAVDALLKASGCIACHTVDKKLVGPTYKDIAAKYRNTKGAEAGLVKKVKEGGKGAWGEVPMPPNPQLKDSDIKTMVEWILTLK